MSTIYCEQHGDISRQKGKQVAIIGYGSQGHAHASNFKQIQPPAMIVFR